MITDPTAERFRDLEAQAIQIMALFAEAGFERIAPEIIQPADVFLDVVGEAIRGRTYVFTDQDGAELCLRPDLTVPACRLYLERHPSCDARSRYYYSGSAFRFQPGGATAENPREFRQAGIEFFGDGDKERAEAEVVALTQHVLKTVGLEQTQLRMGDLGLFRALVEAIDMPERWREQLIHDFWRRDALNQRLKKLTAHNDDREAGPLATLLQDIDPGRPIAARELVRKYLEEQDIPLIGARTIDEIATSLLDRAADLKHGPLDPEAAKLIEAYVSVEAPPKAVGARIQDLMTERGIDLSGALARYQRRIEMFEEAGVDTNNARFSAEFGRNLEYYSGFVFQIDAPGSSGTGYIAGGGRYDGLMEAVGAPHPVSGIGVAIHTERLLNAINAAKAPEDDA
ncbi:MAG: ATP phosphoribosyltransferase regulatory subunit [Hyphomicrobiaceae bacterium]